MKRLVALLCAVSSLACGGATAPQSAIPTASVAGAYQITLHLQPVSSYVTLDCSALSATVAGSATDWQRAQCGGQAVTGKTDELGGRIDGDTLRLLTSSGSLDDYRFASFRGSSIDAMTSDYVGPCHDAAPGSGVCLHETGTATWTRQH